MGSRLARLGVAASLLLALVTPGCSWVAPFPDVSNRRTLAETPTSQEASPPVVFAVIGDYGTGDRHESAVASLVASWDPAFVLTLGDNHYERAGVTDIGRYERSVGAYYGRWIKGESTGTAEKNAFFPTLGNHDYTDAEPAPGTYERYFNLLGMPSTTPSGNERYYDFVMGEVHFYALNSNGREPDGTSKKSTQAEWLRTALENSTSRWDIVYFHHPPYSSDIEHGSIDYMRWPFAQWGADAVLAGHGHVYERIMGHGVPYFVNGLGGAPRYGFGNPVDGSISRFNDDWGAQRVTVRGGRMTFDFFDVKGALVDSYTM